MRFQNLVSSYLYKDMLIEFGQYKKVRSLEKGATSALQVGRKCYNEISHL
jgi:hypothetical protein